MQGRRRRTPTLTHLDRRGRARMVDVGDKQVTRREATARAEVKMKPATLRAIASGKMPKGSSRDEREERTAAMISGWQALLEPDWPTIA